MDEFELSKYYLKLNINDFTKLDIEKLTNLIKYHSHIYYNQEKQIISDYEYDQLFKKLQILEKKFDIKKWQTNKVWSNIISSTFTKVKHSRPMISLDNTYNKKDLIDFDERVKKALNINKTLKKNFNIQYTIEFKFDWLWIELIYENWELFQAITRWDWIEWEDVTQNVKTIKNIPTIIPYKWHLEIRWEVIMPISSFKELNVKSIQTGLKIFSNPRNAASWSLRLLDTSITAWRNLKFFAYDLVNPSPMILFPNNNINTYFKLIKSLKNFWFEISDYFIECKNIWEVIKNINNFWNKKNKLDFDIDWLVIKVNNISLWKNIGFTAHHPKYAIAYKFPAEVLTTKILSVEHQIWRTWTITPVANLEPIFIDWVVIKRATLHNYDEIKKLWIKIWDNVFIKRAWEVIPKIIWVVDSSSSKTIVKENIDENILSHKDIYPPKICPSCWSNILHDTEKVRFYCPNHLNCHDQIKQKLIYSIWKQCLNINWFWSKQIELFLEKWFISDLWDIFTLKDKKNLILSLHWYKEKSVNNLLSAIENAKTQKIVNFITALNILWVWPQVAKELAKIINNDNKFLNFDFSIEYLSSLKDIWEETAKNIYNFFNSTQNKILIEKLLKYIKIEYTEKIIWWKYEWKKICITWSFKWFSRDELIKKIEKMWWIFVNNVSKNTNFLLAWENTWNKLDKANFLWIQIINLEEFLL